MARILLVEDDKFISRIIEDILLYHAAEKYSSRYELNITKAENAIKALEILNRFNFELIITDVMMAKMDGFEFIKEVRKQHKQTDLPIIVLSVIDWDDLSYQCVRVGATAWFTKTFTGENLEKFLKVAFNLISER